MNTNALSISQLWNEHWKNPNDMNIRVAIVQRDPGGIGQLSPFAPFKLSDNQETAQDESEDDDDCDFDPEVTTMARQLEALGIR